MAAPASVELPSAVVEALASLAADRGFKRPRFRGERGSEVGDGFTSVVFRVAVSDEDASSGAAALSAICKTTVTGAAVSFIAIIFRSEDCMYKVVLAAMQELVHFAELPWPRCLLSSLGGKAAPVLVLEDLRPDGFAMADRSRTLDEKHCRLALRQVARFHAGGMAFKLRRPAEFKAASDLLISSFTDPQMQESFNQFFAMIVNVPDMLQDRFPDEILQKVRTVFVDFSKHYGEQALSPPEAPGNAIIHGDCHINNIMFQYDQDGAVTGCKLIDFQTARFGGTALDVCSLLLPCTERAMRAEHFDDLLRGYHAELQATLRAAGVEDPDDVYSWDQFMDALRTHFKLSLCLAPVLLHALSGDKATQQELADAIQDMDKLTDKSGGVPAAPPAFQIKENPEMKRRFGDLVQDLVDWGWL